MADLRRERDRHRMSTADYEQRALPAFHEIFKEADPWSEPFTEAATSRLLLFPMSYSLERPQFDSLSEAARGVGDEAMYVWETEIGEHVEPWKIDLGDWEGYDTLRPTVETAHISPSGAWGMLTSHEDHAVVGGIEPFVTAVAESFPATENPGVKFIFGSGAVEPSRKPRFRWPFRRRDVVDELETILNPLIAASDQVPNVASHPPRDQALAFLDRWEVYRRDLGSDVSWIPSLLEHIYGPERAQELLDRAMFVV